MGLVFNRSQRALMVSNPADLIARRPMSPAASSTYVNTDKALHISTVWSAVRLRADLISTMPFSCWRYASVDTPDANDKKIKAPLSPFMSDSNFMEFLYSSQVALDTDGNAIGIIHKKDMSGYPADIELVPANAVEVLMKGRQVSGYRIYGEIVPPDWVWHEKQFTFPGLHVGLSPVMYAAYQIGQYQSVQQFAIDWFVTGQGPRASLQNVDRKIDPKEAMIVKEAWAASQTMGEPFVHGSNWKYDLVYAQSASNDWLQAQKLGRHELAQMFGVPAGLIDASDGGSSLTYANVNQRQLQFLVFHLGPTIRRRQNALSKMLPRPRFIEFNTDELLRMDPPTRAAWIKTQIDARTLAPNEARAMDNRAPFTDEQINEFELLGLNKTATGALAGAADIPVPPGTQTEPAQPDEPAPPADSNLEGNTK